MPLPLGVVSGGKHSFNILGGVGMEEIKAFRASDGKIFLTSAEANLHESVITRTKTIVGFVEDHCWNNMNKGDVICVLEEHVEDLILDLSSQ